MTKLTKMPRLVLPLALLAGSAGAHPGHGAPPGTGLLHHLGDPLLLGGLLVAIGLGLAWRHARASARG